tara:strand:- start:193 stop:369 length:177 start_codon:yes stop_codon:yes gene_type:complete
MNDYSFMYLKTVVRMSRSETLITDKDYKEFMDKWLPSGPKRGTDILKLLRWMIAEDMG